MLRPGRKAKLHRRDLLRASAGLILAPSWVGARDADTTTDVLIVGAGMAGLACGQRLRDAGRSIRILEARDRTGGRIWTRRSWPEVPVEMGARWIHGGKANPLYPLVDKLGLTTERTDFDSIEGFRSDGRKYTLDQLAEGFLDESRWEKYIDQRRREGFRADQAGSLADLLREWPGRRAMDPARQELFDLAVRSEITLDYGAELPELAWPGYDHGLPLEGPDLTLNEGYDRLIEAIAANLPIQRETIVQEIDWSGTPVIVRTSRGEFRAQAVVVTLPLGVLQQGSVRFRPELPREKKEAIHRLGMSQVSKIALRFPLAFWPRREIFLFAGDPGKSFEAYHLGVWNKAPVLQTYQAGQAAILEQGLAPSERVESVLLPLRRAFPKTFVEPSDFMVTDWTNDPFARGAYSFVKTGSLPQHREDLAFPLERRLFFAGEATSIDHPSTVHGAYLSGLREAKRILRTERLS
jgi:monoamine oxidase